MRYHNGWVVWIEEDGIHISQVLPWGLPQSHSSLFAEKDAIDWDRHWDIHRKMVDKETKEVIEWFWSKRDFRNEICELGNPIL